MSQSVGQGQRLKKDVLSAVIIRCRSALKPAEPRRHWRPRPTHGPLPMSTQTLTRRIHVQTLQTVTHVMSVTASLAVCLSVTWTHFIILWPDGVCIISISLLYHCTAEGAVVHQYLCLDFLHNILKFVQKTRQRPCGRTSVLQHAAVLMWRILNLMLVFVTAVNFCKQICIHDVINWLWMCLSSVTWPDVCVNGGSTAVLRPLSLSNVLWNDKSSTSTLSVTASGVLICCALISCSFLTCSFRDECLFVHYW